MDFLLKYSPLIRSKAMAICASGSDKTGCHFGLERCNNVEIVLKQGLDKRSSKKDSKSNKIESRPLILE